MKQLLPFACGAGLLAGCSYTIVPHTPYLPVIRDRGQAEARISTGLNGSELLVGYQLTDKLLLHTAVLTHGRTVAGNKFRSADLGLGYYYNSPNGIWRLGLHAGVAHGVGNSGQDGCFECPPPDSTASNDAYALRYTYAYVQPTVLLLDNEGQSWGVGLRIGQAYYHQFDAVRTYRLSRQQEAFDYAGHRLVFFQPTVQGNYRVSRWLTLSGTLGGQAFLKNGRAIGHINPFVGQLGAHFVVGQLFKRRP